MPIEGAKTWYIPDAYLPEPIEVPDGPYFGHESICVLNTNEKDAKLELDFYFEDREPVLGVAVTIPAQRSQHVRLDMKPGGFDIPLCVPYSIRVRSDIPIIVQYSRLDTTQVQCTLMTTIAYPLTED